MKLNDLKNNGTITVMYHYVRDNEVENTPNLHSLDRNDFKKQLDWLQIHFESISYEEYDKCIKENLPFPDNKFLLTFDDGLKDHYKYVYPELKISFEFLKDTFNLKDIVFCYPYGHTHTYNKDTVKILQNLDCHSAFNTLRDTTCIVKADKYQLQRFDTVDISKSMLEKKLNKG